MILENTIIENKKGCFMGKMILDDLRKRLELSLIHISIEQVQQLLGHQKIDTTMHYAMVKQQNVKLAHRKFIG